ncbi:MAG TPA: hypothetical protein VFS31_07265 [Chitinophagaceae bacterium]|jgi:hypothetical protein|nr:hypothetical protein [Chitinophagaceae bacterium]
MDKTGNEYKSAPLLLCLVMDALGYLSYSLPFAGELSDLLWAPISALIFYLVFGRSKAALPAVFNFLEEILPGTDFIPSFTLMWIWRYFSRSSKVSARMRI